jgi:hypothetical protein
MEEKACRHGGQLSKKGITSCGWPTSGEPPTCYEMLQRTLDLETFLGMTKETENGYDLEHDMSRASIVRMFYNSINRISKTYISSRGSTRHPMGQGWH